ncbi:MAG: hypothetical protein SOX69_04610 [Oscillospiraceae bacterium]|nr:hypothetical protein [Oscillospiraceae bacterium]
MKRSNEIFYKIIAVLLAVLAVAVFTGKAGRRTSKMLGEERTKVLDSDDIKEYVRRTVDFFGVALR